MERTWKISWFVWNNGKGVKTKDVYKTVDTNDYPDRECEKHELRDQAYIDYDWHPSKLVLINEVSHFKRSLNND